MADDGSEKNLEPTSKRREDFRKQGRYPKARDLGGIAAMGSVLGVLAASKGLAGQALHTLFGRTLGDVGAMSRGEGQRAAEAALGCLAMLTVPAMIAASLAGVVMGIVQAGWHPNWDALAPKPERFDVFSRLKQTFSPKHAAGEIALALLRVAVVAWAVRHALDGGLGDLLLLSRTPIDGGASRLAASVTRVVLWALGSVALIAVIDYAQSWFSLEKDMKMSRKEMEEETRQSEGDPKSKGRLRQRARAMIRKRSVAKVKEADVVVTNPTHVAVALRYGAKDPAPIVVAKGHDALAMMIRAEARKHGVPILEHRALARAIDAEVEVGRTIQAKHFQAVAKVLAFVYRLRRPGARSAR